MQLTAVAAFRNMFKKIVEIINKPRFFLVRDPLRFLLLLLHPLLSRRKKMAKHKINGVCV